jgi:hypothetical protein
VVELRDIQLPDSMQRAMARQAEAEAEREKRAKIIAAQGEALAAGELAHASDVMMAHLLAPQLRNLQTLVELGVDKNSHRRFPSSVDEHDRESSERSSTARPRQPQNLPPRRSRRQPPTERWFRDRRPTRTTAPHRRSARVVLWGAIASDGKSPFGDPPTSRRLT